MSDEPKEFDQVVKSVSSSSEQKTLRDSAEGQFRVTESPAFRKFRADLSDAQIAEIRRLAPLRTYEIDIDGQTKTFTRKKIRAKDYVTCEKIRAKLIRETDIEKMTDLQFELYELWAKFYLGMESEDFDNADFEILKRILDTCNIVTVQGVPNGT